MYYSLVPDQNQHNFAQIHPNDINKIDGLSVSQVVGQFGVARIQQCINHEQEIRSWLGSLGYYSNFAIPPRRYDYYDSSLSLFPDNEEMLVIYNNSTKIITCNIQTSTFTLPTVKFALRDWYDNLWCETFNDNYNTTKHFTKNITEAVNFYSKNKTKYNPPRHNQKHLLKMIPRHPLKTQCVFYPQFSITKFKEWYAFDIEQNHRYYKDLQKMDNLFRGFTLKIQPNDIIILDQIITKFYFDDDISQIKMFPLWYKTEVRKHFNYSI